MKGKENQTDEKCSNSAVTSKCTSKNVSNLSTTENKGAGKEDGQDVAERKRLAEVTAKIRAKYGTAPPTEADDQKMEVDEIAKTKIGKPEGIKIIEPRNPNEFCELTSDEKME